MISSLITYEEQKIKIDTDNGMVARATIVVVKTTHEHREGMHFKTTFFRQTFKIA
jgi:hypothetical protein